MSLDEKNDERSPLVVRVEPDAKVYWRALRDVTLRAILAVAILAVGCWIPASYLQDISSWYWMDPDPVVRLASLVSKVAVCIYGVIALWRFRCVFDNEDRIEQSRRLFSE